MADDIAEIKETLRLLLILLEKQQESLKTIADCLQKISGAMMTRAQCNPTLSTFITNADSYPYS